MAFCWPIRVYIEDTDFGGIVYYVNYLKFMERARTEMLRASGWTQEKLRESGYLFVVGQVSANYSAPAKLDDQLEIQTKISFQRGARARFSQTAVNLAEDEILCEAEVELICVEPISFKPRRWPKGLIHSIRETLPQVWVEQE